MPESECTCAEADPLPRLRHVLIPIPQHGPLSSFRIERKPMHRRPMRMPMIQPGHASFDKLVWNDEDIRRLAPKHAARSG